MLDLKRKPYWYALYTRARCEKKVAQLLCEKGVETFLPLRTETRQWHDRKKKVTVPLFANYVFTRITMPQRVFVVQTSGVVRIVSFSQGPSPIPDHEINAIRRILMSPASYEVTNFFTIGDEVEIRNGLFAGIRGRLIEYRGKSRLVVGIKQIGQALSVELSPNDIQLAAVS